MKIDYIGKPQRPFKDLIEEYSKSYLVLEDVLSTRDTYRVVYQDILDILKYGFEYELIRHKMIKFKLCKKSKKMYELQMNHFLSNMILWRAFVEMDNADTISEDHIFNFHMASLNDIVDYIDSKLLPICDLPLREKNRMVDDMAYHMRAISTSFSIIMGMGMSVYNIYTMEKQYPEIGEIMYGTIDSSLQPVEIEKILHERTERLVDLFTLSDNDLRPLFLSGKNLSQDQFKEIMVKIGLKADPNGNTIPFLIDCNILVDGISRPSYQYLEAKSARKALVLSKTKMGDPGSFSKKINNNTNPTVLSKTTECCNSMEYIDYYIADEKYLKLLDKRYYVDEGGYRLLNWTKDKHLIGKTVSFKSPMTCTCKDGVCKTCYGALSDINADLFSIGGYSSTKESEPYGQRILSSKHSQITTSQLIQLCDDFYNIFEMSSSEITIRQDFEEDAYIQFDNITVEDSGDETFYFTSKINILDTKGKIIFSIYEENGVNFYLSPELINLYRKSPDKPISLDIFDDSTILFYTEIKNVELSKPLNDIEDLINKNDHLGCKTLSSIAQKFLELKIAAGIMYNAVHHEIILRQLVRKKSNVLERPDFSPTGDPDDYQILRLNDALFRNPSPTICLTNSYLRKTLISPDLYEKSQISPLDPMLLENIYGVRNRDEDPEYTKSLIEED